MFQGKVGMALLSGWSTAGVKLGSGTGRVLWICKCGSGASGERQNIRFIVVETFPRSI